MFSLATSFSFRILILPFPICKQCPGEMDTIPIGSWVLEIYICEPSLTLMHIHVFAKQMYKYTLWVSENWYPLRKITITSVYLPELASVGQESGQLRWEELQYLFVLTFWCSSSSQGEVWDVCHVRPAEGELKVEEHLWPVEECVIGILDGSLSHSVTLLLLWPSRGTHMKSSECTVQLFSSLH